MALFENFPYTNLHELNLDWLIQELKTMQEQTVLSVNGQTGEVVLYTQATVQFPEVSEDHWSIIRLSDGTTRGILFGNDDKAYIVHGGLMAQVYAQNNPPPYPVTSVNNMTGDIVLYAEQYVQLPALTDASMHSWSLFRKIAGVNYGIDFDDTGNASLIDGMNRYKLYTENNPPFADNNGAITFDAYTNPNVDGWVLQRNVNGTPLGLTLNDDGTLTFKVGSDEYTVYTSYDGVFTDPTDNILEIKEDATDYVSWGMLRETANGKVGIVFNNTDPDAPTAWLAYVDSNMTQQTVQLLTTADIPAGAGVITVNGLYGVVTLYGTNIQVSSGDSRSIQTALEDIIDDEYDMNNSITYTERGNTATQNIPLGKYVIWKNKPYVSIASIAIGDTLSSSNLTLLSHGIIDNLLGAVNSNTNQISTLNGKLQKYAIRTVTDAVGNTAFKNVTTAISESTLLTDLSATEIKEIIPVGGRWTGGDGTSYAVIKGLTRTSTGWEIIWGGSVTGVSMLITYIVVYY